MINEQSISAGFVWPMAVLPQVRLGGRYFLDDQEFGHIYRSVTHAVHLYQYRGRIRIADRVYDLAPGDLTFSPAGWESAYDVPKGGYHLCIHFSPCPQQTGEQTLLPLHQSLGPWMEEATRRMQEIARRLNAQPEALSRAAASAELQAFLLWTATLGGSEDEPLTSLRGRIQQAVEQASAHLIENLDEPLRLDDLAREVGFSQNYLARHFHQRFGVTIPHFLLLRRIEFARYLLESTNLPIKTIGVRVGMPDPQHFNKQFRAITGHSPSSARQANRREAPPEP